MSAWFRNDVPIAHVAAFYAVGLALALVAGSALTVVVVPLSGGRSPVIVAPLVAAVVEPVGSKLLPVLALTGWFARRDPDRRRALGTHPFRLGALGGVVVGGGEIAVKLLATTGLYGSITTLTGGVFLPIALHAVTGGLIGNAVLRSPENRHHRRHDPAAATAAAVLLHLAWNGALVVEMVSRVS